MGAIGIVNEREEELKRENLKDSNQSEKHEKQLEKVVNAVITNYPLMQNVFDSVGWASDFNKSVGEASEKMKKAISNSKVQLSEVNQNIKKKIA